VVVSGHLWLLLFKKPYCPWCADFDFEWQTAAYDLRTAPRVRGAIAKLLLRILCQ